MPSKLTGICVESGRLEDEKLVISWDLRIPVHCVNCSMNITDYTVYLQDTLMPDEYNNTIIISSSDNGMTCKEILNDSYECSVNLNELSKYFNEEQCLELTVKVAATNCFGEGSFSDPVYIIIINGKLMTY